MRAVYIHKVYLHLKTNGLWKYVDDNVGRYVYLYGEVPENKVEKFENKNTVFSDLIKKIGYNENFQGNKTFWKKRIYILLFPLAREIVYKDELEAFELEHIYEVVENPDIELLKKDLGFKGYSQLIFDREQELKSMLIDRL